MLLTSTPWVAEDVKKLNFFLTDVFLFKLSSNMSLNKCGFSYSTVSHQNKLELSHGCLLFLMINSSFLPPLKICKFEQNIYNLAQ